jgi:phage terminase large subunit
MSILFVQTVGQEIRIVDSYTNTGYGFEHYSEVLKQKGYKYKEHWFPHDIRHRELSTGTSRIETAIRFMGNICKIVPMNTIESGISATRLIFKNLWIDEKLDSFLNNISLYQYEMDEKLGMLKKQPKHDFTSHDADTLRYMSTVYEHIIKSPRREEAREELDGMDLLIFGDDEPEEEDEQLLDTAY